MDIKTNNHFQELKYFNEISKKEQQEYKEYYSDGLFVNTKLGYLPLSEFIEYTPEQLDGVNSKITIHGIYGVSYFFAIGIQLSDCDSAARIYYLYS